jgi:hypothetical protein
MIHTEDTSTWRVRLSKSLVGGNTLVFDSARFVLIEPQLPYLYLPENDFKIVANKLAGIYEDIICSYSTKHVCYFNKQCRNVKDQGETMVMNLGPKGESF